MSEEASESWPAWFWNSCPFHNTKSSKALLSPKGQPACVPSETDFLISEKDRDAGFFSSKWRALHTEHRVKTPLVFPRFQEGEKKGGSLARKESQGSPFSPVKTGTAHSCNSKGVRKMSWQYAGPQNTVSRKETSERWLIWQPEIRSGACHAAQTAPRGEHNTLSIHGRSRCGFHLHKMSRHLD